MSCVLRSLLSHEVGHTQQQSNIKWKWYVFDPAQESPEGTNKLHKEVAQMPMVSNSITKLSSVKHMPIGSWDVSYD